MPWCPKCRFEYVEGIEICPECGSKLVAKKSSEEGVATDEERKPKEIKGRFSGWEIVHELETYTEAEIVRGFLESNGIPATTMQISYDLPASEVYFGKVAPYQVLVPKEWASMAREIIQEAEDMSE